ncbi:MAG: nucleotidyl transferase AbiEii/AbiGii toxin family protein [Actinomycetota bacterium]|nr:nucleotidyl transferase AbiEii/AbiGii toxin family protein [Actinomycetota bacterium]
MAREAVDRRTKDVDFFATREEQVRRLQRGLIDAATASGLAVDPLETYPGFSRLLVNDGEQRCEVDLAYDARIQVAESMEYGDVLSLDELAADKVLALFARAEARDFIDVAALLPRYGWPRLCGLAAEKDTGFHIEALQDAIRAFQRLPTSEFDLDDNAYQRLRVDVREWMRELDRVQACEEPSLDL